jgi:hypothetical protein
MGYPIITEGSIIEFSSIVDGPKIQADFAIFLDLILANFEINCCSVN